MYQNQGHSAYKTDLTNTIKLAEYLGNPEKGFRAIHVGGTNGKGSTSHMIASILQEAGYKVGLYTSPHLKDFRERIRINGKPVSKQYVTGFVKEHRSYFEENSLSFFEMTVGMAFDYFNNEQVDIAVVEVGLGGRLDSTNIIDPLVSVITNIGLDHMRFLGNTHELIAVEKAGIIKPGVPVVIGETDKRTIGVFRAKASKCKSKLIQADTIDSIVEYKLDLKGAYQLKNSKTAVVVIRELVPMGMKIKDEHIELGLMNVVKNTGMQGRWQILGENPLIVCDTAHNKEGLEIVMNQILECDYRELHMVLGFVNDKDIERVMNLFPRDAHYYLCRSKVLRAMPVDDLKIVFDSYNLNSESFDSVESALDQARINAGIKDMIFIGGSTFVVAEIL